LSVKSQLLLILLSLAVTGCGFQLRGTDIGAIDSISLSGPSETRRILQQSLETYGVDAVAAGPLALASLISGCLMKEAVADPFQLQLELMRRNMS